MNDRDIIHRIGELVDEEHALYERGDAAGLDAAGHARLRSPQVALDQCRDLLRQRRGLRHDDAYDLDTLLAALEFAERAACDGRA